MLIQKRNFSRMGATRQPRTGAATPAATRPIAHLSGAHTKNPDAGNGRSKPPNTTRAGRSKPSSAANTTPSTHNIRRHKQRNVQICRLPFLISLVLYTLGLGTLSTKNVQVCPPNKPTHYLHHSLTNPSSLPLDLLSAAHPRKLQANAHNCRWRHHEDRPQHHTIGERRHRRTRSSPNQCNSRSSNAATPRSQCTTTGPANTEHHVTTSTTLAAAPQHNARYHTPLNPNSADHCIPINATSHYSHTNTTQTKPTHPHKRRTPHNAAKQRHIQSKTTPQQHSATQHPYLTTCLHTNGATTAPNAAPKPPTEMSTFPPAQSKLHKYSHQRDADNPQPKPHPQPPITSTSQNTSSYTANTYGTPDHRHASIQPPQPSTDTQHPPTQSTPRHNIQHTQAHKSLPTPYLLHAPDQSECHKPVANPNTENKTLPRQCITYNTGKTHNPLPHTTTKHKHHKSLTTSPNPYHTHPPSKLQWTPTPYTDNHNTKITRHTKKAYKHPTPAKMRTPKATQGTPTPHLATPPKKHPNTPKHQKPARTHPETNPPAHTHPY